MNATHASFFSGAGGLDLGLERAGWRTVSFSEIDPYASAVLAQRWPGVPNLGDITRLRADELDGGELGGAGRGELAASGRWAEQGRAWTAADLWSGGFPCQDLSVAGKRRGMGAGTRSGLAFSFLDLVGRHRPRFVLLENVPGLLSSHGGKDFGTLLATLVELGYGVGYRVLDARYFGVPQRRRRVFILGDSLGGRAGAERAAEVLSVGSRCHRHPPTGIEAGPGAADGTRPGVDIARAVTGTSGKRYDEDINDFVVSSSPDSRGVRAPNGLAGRSHDRDGVELIAGGEQSYHQRDRIHSDLSPTLDARGDSVGDPPIVAYTKSRRAQSVDDAETWVPGEVSPTLNDFDTGDARAVSLALGGRGMTDDPLLPLGLDSNRYRCCGNGVVSSVSEWIGVRLLEVLRSEGL